MNKSIRNAYNIVDKDKTIRGSQLLTDMHSDILKGLKEMRESGCQIDISRVFD